MRTTTKAITAMLFLVEIGKSGLPPSARQQRQFPPFPVTIHVGESDLAQPLQLGLDIEELV